ncbi:MAG: 3'(2'), 5'-bisphosphate nucleotidase, partial [Flavobacteriaceae bacterium]
MLDFEHLLVVAKEAALQAGEVILEIYATGDFSVEAKSDNSPLTIADQSAHKKISELLAKTGIPILSEEGADVPYDTRKDWEYFWMVDPLDGTKEFIKKNGEFTVNIALIHQTEVVLGVVFTPVTNDLYWALKDFGAYKNGIKISVNTFNVLDQN